MGLPESVGKVVLTTASSKLLCAERVFDESNPGVESRQGEDYAFDWRGAGDEVETNSDIADGGTGIMSEDEQFFVGVVRHLL